MKVLEDRKQLEVLRLLMEGSSISSASRLTGVHRDTCCRLMVRFGEGCRRFLDREMRDLTLEHLQLDELWTFIRKKDWAINRDNDQSDGIGSYYIFVALDEATRLIPSHQVDKRNQQATLAFIKDLYERLRKRTPHESDAHAFQPGGFQPITRISTDAFDAYPEAINQVFGPYASYGVLVKHTSGRRLIGISKSIRSGNIDPEQITTSLVERSNLTMRLFMKRLTRRTMCFSKKLPNLRSAVSMQIAAYNYCHSIKTFRKTPAQAAGLINKRLSHAELYEHVRSSWPELFFLERKADVA